MNAGAIKKVAALVVVVLATSGSMTGRFRPRPSLQTRHTITNAVPIVPLCDLVAQFLDAETETENTRKAYRNSLRVFTEFVRAEMGRKPEALSYSHVTRNLIGAFRDSRLEVEAPKTVDLRLSAVKRLCSWATDSFGVPNPAVKVERVKLSRPEFLGLTENQYRALLAAARAEPDYRKRYAVRLAVWTGLRNDELCTLRLGQFSAKRDFILNVSGKSTALRDIPISADARLATAEYLIDRSEHPVGPTLPVFWSGRASTISNKTLWAWVHDVCLAAKIPAELAHPHTLRHTFAHRTLRMLIDGGEGLDRAVRLLMLWLGHTSIETTMQYLGLDARDPKAISYFQDVRDY